MSAVSDPQRERRTESADRLANTVTAITAELFGEHPPVAVETWDGRRIGPDAPAPTIRIHSSNAVARLVRRPGQLALARAFALGEITVEGDLLALMELSERLGPVRLKATQWLRLARRCGRPVWGRQPVPVEEARLTGRRHDRVRDRKAISHHYDVSNEFYRLILGPSMTYSCAVWGSPTDTLERAQERKHELVCAKLGLRAGDRLLDVGCGWGTMARHAARGGVAAVGVTLSLEQLTWTRAAQPPSPADEDPWPGPDPLFRLQDYRDVEDGPYDAISSIGMSEHVGRAHLDAYFSHLYGLLRPGGRLVNQAISALPAAVSPSAARWPGVTRFGVTRRSFRRNSFVDRYIFPDGELVEVGLVVSAMQRAGFEVRHVESLREHYGLTLRTWVKNLQNNWDLAVATVGAARARIWLVYLAASARTFETDRTGIHQVLAVKPDRGRSGMPLRPVFDDTPISRTFEVQR